MNLRGIAALMVCLWLSACARQSGPVDNEDKRVAPTAARTAAEHAIPRRAKAGKHEASTTAEARGFELARARRIMAAATVDVVDPGQGNDIRGALQTALNNAADGDVIRLPNGKFLVSGQITIRSNLHVSIIGRGIWNESAGVGTMLYFSQTQSAASNIMFQANSGADPTFSDFTIRGAPAEFLDNSIGIRLSQPLDFRITRMRVEYFGRAGINVAHSDTQPRGLIDHNSLFHNYKGDGQGLGYGVVIYGQNLQWIADARFGSEHFIFIEDNHFERHRHAIAAGGAGLYVARYNYMKDTFIASAIDAHESSVGRSPGDSNYYSTRAIEAYRNTIINTLSKQMTPITPDTVSQNGGDTTLSSFGIGIRGGEALVHHNVIQGYLYGGAIVDNYYADRADKSYPIASQVGYASGLALGAAHSGRDAGNGNGDFFYWANRFTPHPFGTVPWWYTGNQPFFYNYTTAIFKENRDYHLSLSADVTGVDYSFKPGYRPYTYPHPRATGGVSRLDVNVPVHDISASAGSEYVWAVTVGSALPELQFQVSGGTGTAEIHVKRNDMPTTTDYDCRSNNQPSRNACRLAPALPGTYYVRVRAATAVEGVRLGAVNTRMRSNPLPAN